MNKNLFFKKIYQISSLMLLGVLVLAACQAAPVPTSAPILPPPTAVPSTVVPPTVAPAPTSIPAPADAVINIATDAKYGKILVDGKGMVLYMFTKDEANKSNCAEACLKNWPPLLTQGSPKLGDGVDKALVGSAVLPDGTKIVTYNKMPLYYWVKDTKAGETTGLGVSNAWYLVAPDGKVVGNPATAAVDAVINVATDAKYGKILVDGKGMTLYMFTKDEANKSNCADACLKNWPPLLTQGNPTLGAGVDKALVGFAVLPDGTKIVTYNKMPLYYWVKDVKPGDITGLGVSNAWYFVAPDGKVVGNPATVAVDAVINVATDAKYGKILVDGKGMVLYMFTKDEANKSNCAEACLKNWPPLLTQGSPTLGAGVDKALVGSAVLPDGTKIVTYNKMPLYYWVKDTKAGETTGLGVSNAWYLVAPDGKVVGKPPM